MCTPRQKEVLDAIASLSERGFRPTIREVADALGIGSTRVQYHLAALRSAGLVTWEPSTPRTLRVLDIETAPSSAA